jgi:hypothetical protein
MQRRKWNKLDNEVDAFLGSEVDNENGVQVKEMNFNNKVNKSGNAYVKLTIHDIVIHELE